MKRVLIALSGIIMLTMPVMSFAGVCGDANNDGVINLLDILYLIDYKYSNPPGPEPDCGEETGTITDIDGNIYQTIKIGDQWWMMENLMVTHYRNGDPIAHVTDGGTWSSLTSEAYCNYGNDEGNVATYGRLYNWYAVDDSRNIAPAGWHVPSDEEWQTLVDYLGGNADAGGKLKEAGTAHWNAPNEGATNESGFLALPGGSRHINGDFVYMGLCANFWSSTEFNDYGAWHRSLDYLYTEIYRYEDYKRLGFSVRCVRD